MKRLVRKVISLSLALAMVFTMMPTVAMADTGSGSPETAVAGE